MSEAECLQGLGLRLWTSVMHKLEASAIPRRTIQPCHDGCSTTSPANDRRRPTTSPVVCWVISGRQSQRRQWILSASCSNEPDVAVDS